MNNLGKPNRSRIVRITRDHLYYETSNRGNISEARLAYATHLERNLSSQEVVVNKTNNPDNVDISNLLLVTRKQANMITRRRRFIVTIERMQCEVDMMSEYLTTCGINLDTMEKDTDRGRLVDDDRELVGRRR